MRPALHKAGRKQANTTKKNDIMKEYTTRYNTKKMRGVCYSFRAESDEAAKCFVIQNFAGITNVQLYNDTDTAKACAGRLVATIKHIQ